LFKPLDQAVYEIKVTLKNMQGEEIATVSHVVEAAINIEAVASFDDLVVEYGTALEELDLPEQVDVAFHDGSVRSVDVIWDSGTPEYDGTVPGTYTFTGTLVLDELMDNPLNLTARINVIVSDPVLSTYEFRYEVPSLILAGEDVIIPVTFATKDAGHIGYDAVRFEFSAAGPGDVTFKAVDSEDRLHTFTNSGAWGPPGGFPLPADYEATTEWTLNFAARGDYTITFRLVDLAAGEAIAEVEQAVTVTVPTALSMSADDITGISVGDEFTMPVTVQGTVFPGDVDNMVRFYGVIPGLSAGDIELASIPGGKPEIVTDPVERAYAGAAEGDLVLAWGPRGGFPLGTYDYTAGRTTEFKAAINKAGSYTVTFVFYDLTKGKQINAAGETAAINVAPVFNGSVSGVIYTDETGKVTAELSGDFEVTIDGQVTEYTGNRATFAGTVTGDIEGNIEATINANGIDTLSGIVTGTGAIQPVRVIGIFPQTGITGDFRGRVITGPIPVYVESMSIKTPGDVDTVAVGETLQMSVEVLPEGASDEVAWSVWTKEGEATDIATIDQETGLLTAKKPGQVVVIAKALDGSLNDAVKTINVVGKVLNATTGATYLTIQEAIDAAGAGDTITVAAGNYNESLTINKRSFCRGRAAATRELSSLPRPTATGSTS